MALDNAKRFLKQMLNDEVLREQVMEKEPNDVVTMAKELGFDVTAEELSEAMKAFSQSDGSEPQKLKVDEMEQVAGGKPNPGDGIVDFIAWAACGFNHHYVHTGKTKKDVDLVFPVTFYQQRCVDCGYRRWTRTPPPNVQGPKTGNH